MGHCQGKFLIFERTQLLAIPTDSTARKLPHNGEYNPESDPKNNDVLPNIIHDFIFLLWSG